jgi:hypothetical protein
MLKSSTIHRTVVRKWLALAGALGLAAIGLAGEGLRMVVNGVQAMFGIGVPRMMGSGLSILMQGVFALVLAYRFTMLARGRLALTRQIASRP